MSNVLKLMEAIACTPEAPSDEKLQSMLAAADIDAAVGQALLARDVEGLGTLLGARATMVCSILTPEDDAPIDDDQQRDEPQPDEEITWSARVA